MANVKLEEPDVKGVIGKLTQGAVDAGFVYRTDVSSTASKAITLPTDLQPVVEYGAGVVKGAKKPGRGEAVPRRPDQRRVRRRAAEGRIRRRSMRAWFAIAIGAALAVTLAFLTIPVIAIFVDRPPGDVLASLGEPGALDALWLSLRTTAAALAIIVLVGTPAAYFLATRRFRGRALAITLVELPLVLPPAVAGASRCWRRSAAR